MFASFPKMVDLDNEDYNSQERGINNQVSIY